MLYNLLLYMGFQLSELQCPVDITACRISFTFSKLLWDDAHRVSGATGAGITELWLGGKYGCARDFYGTDRSAEGIRL